MVLAAVFRNHDGVCNRFDISALMQHLYRGSGGSTCITGGEIMAKHVFRHQSWPGGSRPVNTSMSRG